MAAWMDSWWVIGTFLVAVIVNLVLFSPNNTAPWYGYVLGSSVIVMIAGSGLNSPLLALLGIAMLVGLVIAGIAVRIREHRRDGSS